MDETVKYDHTADFRKRVSREVLFPRLARILTLSTIGLLVLMFSMRGMASFFLGMLFSFVAFSIAMIIINEQQVVAQAKFLSNPTVTVTFNDDGVTFESEDILSVVKWRRFSRIRKIKSAWLFYYGDTLYTAIPTGVLSDSMKALINKKIADYHNLIQ